MHTGIQKNDRRALIFLVSIILVTFAPVWAGYFYATGDMSDVFVPLELFFQREFLAGRIPSWNPDAAFGFPAIASAQIGFFYPPLLIVRFLPIFIYLPAMFLLHIAAAAIGTFLFLRKLSLSASAAFLGSLAFGLSAFVIQHTPHLNIVITLAWLPWQFLAASFAAKNLRAAPLLMFAASAALPFLAGQIHIPILLAFVSLAFFIYSAKTLYLQKTKTVLAAAVVVGVIAAALAAVQLFPTAELLLHSSRGRDSDFDIQRANQFSFPLYHLPALVFPRFFGSDDTYWGKPLEIEYGFFLGTIQLLLAVWLACHPRLRKSHPQPFFFWLAIITFLLALGSASPFRLFGVEPTLWIFSAPARWLLFTTFALAVFAAYAFDHLKKRSGVYDQKSFFHWLVFTTLAVAFAALSFTALVYLMTPKNLAQSLTKIFLQVSPWLSEETLARPGMYYAHKLSSLAVSLRSSGFSLFSLYSFLPPAALLLLSLLWRGRYRTQAILAITTLELIIIAATASPVVPWSTILRAPDTVAALPEKVLQKQARLVSQSTGDDSGAFLTNPEGRPSLSDRIEGRRLLTPLINMQFSIPGVSWPASLDLPQQTKAVAELYTAENRMIDIAEAAALNIGAVIRLTTDSPSSLEIMPISAVPRASFTFPSAEDSRPSYQEITPAHVRITTDNPAAGTLVVRNTYYPGWEAAVDNLPTAIFPFEQKFQAIEIPSGSHTIDLRYRPASLYLGMFISGLAWVIAGIIACRLGSQSGRLQRAWRRVVNILPEW